MSSDYDKLTEKQKRFIDFYVAKGNASEAAKLAGYRGNNLNKVGSENLAKLDKYIKERLKKLEDERIASATEVLQYFTKVMRDEKEDTNERTKCAENLAKKHGLYREEVVLVPDKPFEVNITVKKQ